jgi:acyl dehydratase
MSTDSPWTRTLAGRPLPGSRAERSRMTTSRDVEMFTAMTGDKNPLHYDIELAAKSPFGGLIVQGGVTTGLLNAVVAEDLPGPGTVFLETNWRFVKAVRVGETITASVKVEHVRGDKPICRLETVVRNADGETCVIGTATTYTMPLLQRETDHAKEAAEARAGSLIRSATNDAPHSECHQQPGARRGDDFGIDGSQSQ